MDSKLKNGVKIDSKYFSYRVQAEELKMNGKAIKKQHTSVGDTGQTCTARS